MHTHTPAHFLVLQMSSHLCHRASRPNLCHTHTSRVQCKCHDHTQETSRTHHTDHPSSHNYTYRDRERVQQWESEKKPENKSKTWHASALCISETWADSLAFSGHIAGTVVHVTSLLTHRYKDAYRRFIQIWWSKWSVIFITLIITQN